MSAWKVLLIGLLSCVCLALAWATFLIPLGKEGSSRWIWGGGLLVLTLGAGALFVLLLRKMGSSLDTKPGWTRR
jgi:hypothetical protein